MPFTLAHPAAVLPLLRSPHFPALVAGSLAPDVVYYLPISMPVRTHSPAGVLTADLLIGLVLLTVGRWLADPLTALASEGWRRRIPPRRASIRSGPAVFAVVVGACTHVLWDSVTQTGGAAVRRWEWLRGTVVEPHRVYNVLGYASSIGGLLALAVVAARWYRRTPPGPARPGLARGPRRWVLTGTVLFVAFGVTHALTAYVQPSGYDLLRGALIGAMRWGAVAFAMYAVAWHLAARRPGYLSRLTT